ncbi:tetratricopeptide repeat protein [Hymenobacter sp. B81]|uniref:tetratricopeptide repeat protein n=1 Tax=Hymenobacter sp. B81 TaxID=3344878 RepID=UPI0037DC291C
MMRSLLVVLMLAGGGLWDGLTRVRDYNAVVQRASSAYVRGRYQEAALLYEQALTLGPAPANLRLNLAHAHSRLGQTARARQLYSGLLTGAEPAVRSVARQQLAVLAARRGDVVQAIALLRQALLDNPTNAEARYNYELLRRYQGRPPQPQIPPPSAPAPKPQAAPTPANTPQPQPKAPAGRDVAPQSAGGPGAATEAAQGQQPGSVRGTGADSDSRSGAPGRAGTEGAAPTDSRVNTRQQRLRQLNLTEAQARQLLDALREREQQYLQQLPHKPTRPPVAGKPAW